MDETDTAAACSGSPSTSDSRPASPECNPNRTEYWGVVPLSSTYGACLCIDPAASRTAAQVTLLYTWLPGQVKSVNPHALLPQPWITPRKNQLGRDVSWRLSGVVQYYNIQTIVLFSVGHIIWVGTRVYVYDLRVVIRTCIYPLQAEVFDKRQDIFSYFFFFF